MNADEPILALDLATRTGWAFHDRACDVLSSGFHEPPKQPDKAFRRGAAFFYLEALLARWTAFRPHVVVEEPQTFRTRDATEVAYGLFAVLHLWAYKIRRRVHRMNPTTLKKWATGKARADKPEMVAAASAKWPAWTGHDDNEADALLLLAFALANPGWSET